jgi:hypothetical protein
MPAEPWVIDHPADPVRVPCSRLRCRRCGAEVRHRDSMAARADARVRAAELYEAPDWSALDWLERDRPARLHACRCTVFRETLHRAIGEERDLFDTLVPDWECSGHPDPALPLSLDGTDLASVDAVPGLVARVLRGFGPPTDIAAMRVMPSLWLRRLAAQAEGTGVDDAVADCLADEIAGANRGAALHFFEHFPRSPHAIAVVDDAARHPGRVFEPAKLPGEGAWLAPTAGDVLVARIGGGLRDELDGRCLAALRGAVVRGGGQLPEGLFDVLARRDAELFARAAPAVERSRPGSWRGVLRALEEAGRDELVLAAGIALAGAEAVGPDDLRGWASAGHRQSTGYALPLLLALQSTASRNTRSLLDELDAACARGIDVSAASRLGSAIAAADPETLFQAAIVLAAEDDEVRRAFFGAVSLSAADWVRAHGAELARALDVEMPR